MRHPGTRQSTEPGGRIEVSRVWGEGVSVFKECRAYVVKRTKVSVETG